MSESSGFFTSTIKFPRQLQIRKKGVFSLSSTTTANILTSYGISNFNEEKVTDRVSKIQTQTGNYALKRSHINEKTIGKWQAVYQWVIEQKVDAFLPILPNHYQQLLVFNGSDYYYVTPWIHNDSLDIHQAFFHAIGKLHGSTLQQQEFSLNDSQREQLEQSLHDEQENYRNQIHAYMEQIEKKRFMSPLELQVVMNYRYLMEMLEVSEYWQTMYVDALEDEMSWSSCLVHGNLKPEHLIITDYYQYFLNWEYTFIGTPTDDLFTLFRHMFTKHDCSMERIVEGFQIYENYVSLSKVEKCSLTLRLLDMSTLFSLIQEVMQEPFQSKRIPLSMELEREWRRLFYGLQLQETLRSQVEAEID